MNIVGRRSRPHGVHLDKPRHDRWHYGEPDQLYFQRECHAPLRSQANWSDEKVHVDGVVRDERSHVSVPDRD